jgi:phosphoribosylformylglycinamidine (FGAM) synthase PurS component
LFEASIYVTLKKGILDPDGKAITQRISSLGVIWEEIIPREKYHQEIQSIINQQESKVEEMLSSRLEQLKDVAQLLMEQEYISGSELRELIREREAIH